MKWKNCDVVLVKLGLYVLKFRALLKMTENFIWIKIFLWVVHSYEMKELWCCAGKIRPLRILKFGALLKITENFTWIKIFFFELCIRMRWKNYDVMLVKLDIYVLKFGALLPQPWGMNETNRVFGSKTALRILGICVGGCGGGGLSRTPLCPSRLYAGSIDDVV